MGDTYNVSGQAGAVGPKARAKQINLYQGGSVPTEGIDLPQLARELEELRQGVHSRGRLSWAVEPGLISGDRVGVSA